MNNISLVYYCYCKVFFNVLLFVIIGFVFDRKLEYIVKVFFLLNFFILICSFCVFSDVSLCKMLFFVKGILLIIDILLVFLDISFKNLIKISYIFVNVF